LHKGCSEVILDLLGLASPIRHVVGECDVGYVDLARTPRSYHKLQQQTVLAIGAHATQIQLQRPRSGARICRDGDRLDTGRYPGGAEHTSADPRADGHAQVPQSSQLQGAQLFLEGACQLLGTLHIVRMPTGARGDLVQEATVPVVAKSQGSDL